MVYLSVFSFTVSILFLYACVFQEGDPTPMDISSAEDETGAFTIGRTKVKQSRKSSIGTRKVGASRAFGLYE